MYILEGHDILVKTKTRTLLHVEDIKLEEGKVFSVIGPNGSGKSTLLRVLALLQEPNSGYVSFRNKVVKPKDKIKVRRKMAVVFQEALLLDTSVIENVMVGLKIRGVDATVAKKKANFWLDKLKISHLSEQWARSLSGGEAQRVSLARALVLEPELLFLDEPFANLDAPTHESLLIELSEILHSTNMTTFFVSHDFNEIAFLSDKILAIIDGKPVQEGDSHTLLERPANEKLAEFLGIENIWDAKFVKENEKLIFVKAFDCVIAVDKDVNLSLRDKNITENQHIKLAIKPDKITIEQQAPLSNEEIAIKDSSYNSICNEISGIIKSIFLVGYRAKIIVDCNETLVKVSSNIEYARNLNEGSKVKLRFSTAAPILFY